MYSNTSIYDPAWCYFPIGMCIGWMSYAGFNVNFRGMAALILIVLWCVRYAVQFPWSGWFTGIEHEDWRYIEMAKRTGSNTVLYWIASLVSLHMTPTLLVFAGLTPLVDVLVSVADETNKVSTAFDVIGISISLSAMTIQRIADNQLYRFRKKQYKVLPQKIWINYLHQRRCVEMVCGITVDTQIILERLSFGWV